MECINDMFPEEITKITNSLLPPNFKGDVGSIRRTTDSVKRILDLLGEWSAQEQHLSRVITTAEKLRTADGHVIYLLKDAEANNGAGDIVGFLKVGQKHLYIFDAQKTVREVEPLCVLDFYVKNTHQRRGLGKKIFDYMLQDQQKTPGQLAVDGPSTHMKSFIEKNYKLKLIKQPNNFAVTPEFFATVEDNARSWTRQKNILSDDRDVGKRIDPKSVTIAAGRYTARHPPSTMSSVIHGDVEQPGQSSEKCQRASSGAPTPASSPLGANAQAAAGLATAGGGAGDPQRPSSLAVAPAPPAAHCIEPATPAGTPSRRDSQLTDKGFFDVKFYHKKLW